MCQRTSYSKPFKAKIVQKYLQPVVSMASVALRHGIQRTREAMVGWQAVSLVLLVLVAYHMKQLEDESSAGAQRLFVAEQVRRHQDPPQVGRLLLLYVDDQVRGGLIRWGLAGSTDG